MTTGTSITRNLAKSDDEVTTAINKAANTLGIVLPGEISITPPTKVRLLAIAPLWSNGILARNNSIAAKTGATAIMDDTQDTLSMIASHFFQVFNFGVSRGKYLATDRAFFHLAIDSSALPNMNSEANLLLWANRIVVGDAARVTAGGAAMSNPTAAEVGDALIAFQAAKNNQDVKEAAYKATLLVLNGLRPEADAVILKVWDETESFYNELPAPAMRDKGRLWGIRYSTKTMVTINLTFLNNVTSAPIDEVATHFDEGDTDHVSNALGIEQIITTVADLATFVSVKAGYTTDTTAVPIVTGTLIYNVVIKMIPV